MKTLIINCISMVLLVMIGGCASQVTSEVTRFHQDMRPMGETVAVVPLDQARQGSLEFSAYAKLVERKLAEIGYQVVAAGAKPDLLAKMDYAVGPAQTKIRSMPRNFVYYRFNYGYFHPYYFGNYWDQPEVYSYTVYPRTLDLTIARASGESLFEGHVKSIGRQQNINQVMPYLVEAMFNNYPGESGVTKVVTIQKDGSEQPF